MQDFRPNYFTADWTDGATESLDVDESGVFGGMGAVGNEVLRETEHDGIN